MPTDILIGAADLYNVKDVKPWIISAKASGFKGDIYLICYRVSDELRSFATEHGVSLYEVDHTPYSTAVTHAQGGSPTQSHTLRFYHAWELLTRLDPTEYRYCIMTDVRDVYFQRDPTEFMEFVGVGEGEGLASSEGIAFGKEEWNQNNLIQGFGQIHYDVSNAAKWTVYNVGVLAGDAEVMANLFQTLYAMTEGRFYPSDQSSFNILMRGLLREKLKPMTMYEPWAAQMGTTNDPTKAWLWERLDETRPVIKDQKVYTAKGELFAIVHQFDRVPELKQLYG